jgi:Salmonella virulence plasmid 65kDa B protein
MLPTGDAPDRARHSPFLPPGDAVGPESRQPTGPSSDGAPALGPSQVDAGTPTTAGYRPPVVSVPKGGGALRGIGEKFATNPATGTGSLSIPVPVTPGRSDFTPALGLGYDSGHGNGPFGLGWQLDLHAVTRKTDKGVPRYRGLPDSEPGPGGGDADRYDGTDDAQGTPLNDTFLLASWALVGPAVGAIDATPGRFEQLVVHACLDGAA